MPARRNRNSTLRCDADQIEQIRTELTKAGFQLVSERV